MSRHKDFLTRQHVEKTFSTIGVIGAADAGQGVYKRLGETSLQVVLEGVGSANTVQPQGRLTGQAAWQNIGSVITGLASGTTVDISKYDEYRFSVGVYDGADDTAEVQHIAFSAVPDAGAWKIQFNGVKTTALAFDAAAAAVQAALRISTGYATLTVAGDYTAGFDITFPEYAGNVGAVTVTDNTLLASAVAVVPTVTTTTQGTQGTDDSKLIFSGFYS